MFVGSYLFKGNCEKKKKAQATQIWIRPAEYQTHSAALGHHVAMFFSNS